MRRPVSTMLTQGQIEVLRRYGQTRKSEAGQVLVKAGDAEMTS